MRDLIAGDCEGYLTLFLETGSGLHNAGHIQRDSSGAMVDIRVSANGFPFINDWDEDGRKDIILGETYAMPPATGNVRAYLNTGTNSSPAFRNHSLIYASGAELFVDHSDPVVYDLDGDSVKDLIVGGVTGYLYFFKNIGTNAAPIFNAEYETLQTAENMFIDALTHSRSNFIDWTGDGDLDIVLGGQDGYVWVCENATDVSANETNEKRRMIRMNITPNPCSGNLIVKFQIPNSPPPFPSPLEGEDKGGGDLLCIKIFDASGRLVKSFNHSTFQPFNHIIWSGLDNMGRPVPTGVYFVKLTAGDKAFTQKVVLLK
ncbi:MAG TPA: T9SS type A sorting domain-containing protein [bacterium]